MNDRTLVITTRGVEYVIEEPVDSVRDRWIAAVAEGGMGLHLDLNTEVRVYLALASIESVQAV